jgi:hypothetical protein
MIVKIINCTERVPLYTKHIGKIVNVLQEFTDYYFVTNETKNFYILKRDCEVIYASNS